MISFKAFHSSRATWMNENGVYDPEAQFTEKSILAYQQFMALGG